MAGKKENKTDRRNRKYASPLTGARLKSCCFFCLNESHEIDYKNIAGSFAATCPARAKIRSRQISSACRRQRQVAVAPVKRARQINSCRSSQKT